MEWLTTRELMAERDVARSTVWRWAAAGLLAKQQVAPRAQVRWRVLTPAEREERARVKRGVTNEYGEYV
jgi:hypothetical protein